jgi:hypothetical protein
MLPDTSAMVFSKLPMVPDRCGATGSFLETIYILMKIHPGHPRYSPNLFGPVIIDNFSLVFCETISLAFTG